jgi:hypothetical protein
MANPLFGPSHPIAINGITVIWSYQNSSRIDKPYIVLDYTSDDVPDHEHYADIDADGNREINSWRKAVIDMQFYCGPDSMKIASALASWFSSEASLNKQMDLNVSIGNRLFLSRMPAMINTSQYEERAIYQFDFYYMETITEWVSWIDTVVVDGTYTDSLTEVTCEETISAKEYWGTT